MKKLKDLEVTVPYWVLDAIRLRADFYDAGEDRTSPELEAALDAMQAAINKAMRKANT